MVASLRKKAEAKKAEAQAWARARGLKIRTDDGSRVKELMEIRNGRPIYYTTCNASAAISTKANLVRNAPPYSVDGFGVTVGVWDAGAVRSTHQEFGGRVTLKEITANHWHATHVGGTIGASGVQVAARGMAPAVMIDSYHWDDDEAEMTLAGASAPNEAGRIYLSNHSYGIVTGWDDGDWHGTDGFGQYSQSTRAWDEVVYSAPYYLPFKSSGNDRDEDQYKNGYDTIPEKGSAKNVITVGAVNDARGMTAFSSWGPSDDGRIKPDIVANGYDVYSTDSGYNSDYETSDGTSMSSPNACGSAALLVDLYDDLLPGRAMRASTLKGLIIHTAVDLGRPGPDYEYGWGLMDTKAAADLILDYAGGDSVRMSEVRLSSSTPRHTASFTADGSLPIRVTVCWTDPPGSATSLNDSRIPRIVNDLDLRMTGPGGTYYPYKLSYSSPSSVATTYGENNVDNVEQIYIATPSPGAYTVTVDYDGSLYDGEQWFSMLMSEAVTHTVTFRPGARGSISSANDGVNYSVNVHDGAAAPAAPLVTVAPGWVHTGWSPAPPSTIRSDVVTTATYGRNTGTYSGGSGTEADPYQIATKGDLLSLADNTGDYDKRFLMTADIDLSGRSFRTAVIAPDRDSSSSGFQGVKFTGVFDGDGHVVRNLTIDTDGAHNDYLGLFGCLAGSSAQIANLGVENVSVTGGDHSELLGGLCGFNQYGTISRCYSVGSVSGGARAYSIGGLCGANKGTVSGCYSTGSVSGGEGAYRLGGLCGYNIDGAIDGCYATGSVSGGHSVEDAGGLCGYNWHGTISDCYSTGSVRTEHGRYMGGLCGRFNFGEISRCYSTGSVSGGASYQGGLVGHLQAGTISNSFWDTQTSGRSTSAGGTGKTTAQMRTQSTFTDAGWDFVGEAANGTDSTWYMAGYPALYGFIAPALDTLAITGPASINEGTSASYTCTAYYSDGSSADVTASATWSENSAYSTISSAGLLTASNVSSDQSVTITATHSKWGIARSDTHVVTLVDVPALEMIEITGSASIDEATSASYTCTAYYSDGSSDDVTTSATWSVNSAYATISDVGLLTALRVASDKHVTVTVSYSEKGLSKSDAHVVTISNVMHTVTFQPGAHGFIPAANSGDNRAVTVRDGDVAPLDPSVAVDPGWVHAGWSPALPATIVADAVTTATYAENDNSYSGGSGTEAAPYQIATKVDLLCLSVNTGDYDKHFLMTADIDMSGRSFATAVIAPDTDSTTDIFRGVRFTGVFDGDGHIIADVTIDTAGAHNNYLGLFGYLDGPSARIINLGVESIAVIGGNYSDYAGNLCGANDSGTIAGCYTTGSLSGGFYLGGLCGRNSLGTIRGCYSTGSVSGHSAVGGLCGENSLGTIRGCYSTGSTRSLSGSSSLGGLCGLQNGTISDCFWDVQTSGLSSSDGGTGKTTSQMQSRSTFTQAGWDLVGETANGVDDTWYMRGYPVLYSFAPPLSTVVITGPDSIDEETTEHCTCTAYYSDGSSFDVTASANWSENSSYASITSAGLLTASRISSDQSVTITVSYSEGGISKSDTHVTTIDNARHHTVTFHPGAHGSISAANSGSSYVVNVRDGDSAPDVPLIGVDPGWIHTGWSTAVPSAIVAGVVTTATYAENDGSYSGGSGTEADPYHIATAGDLLSLSANTGDYDKHFVMTADVDLWGIRFRTAVIAASTNSWTLGDFDGVAFTGVFDGDGHSIRNTAIVHGLRYDYLGLFGYVDGSSAQIMNLGVENMAIAGGYEAGFKGGLCGYIADGTISNCYATGSVRGGSHVGGLCGGSGGTIVGCYSTVSVSDDYVVGGLCGTNSGTISGCYSTGSVSGRRVVGGLCGPNSGTITGCYSTGSVSSSRETDARWFGGLCGYNADGTISDCYSTGSVRGGRDSEFFGGLCGSNGGKMLRCYSTGAVGSGGEAGSKHFGGLCGRNTDDVQFCYSTGSVSGGAGSERFGGLSGLNIGRITHCYSIGSVRGGADSADLGGLCGHNRFGFIEYCYSSGSVRGGSDSSSMGGLCGSSLNGTAFRCYSTGSVTGGSNSSGLGGLCGGSGGRALACFWDTERSGMSTSHGGTGRTTTQMQTRSTFTDAGWDVGETIDGSYHTWYMVGYPALREFVPTVDVLEITGPGSVDEETSVSYTCTADYSNGRRVDVTTSAIWSENSAHATIGSNGVLTASSVPSDQSVTITATFDGQGATKTATLRSLPSIDAPEIARRHEAVSIECAVSDAASGTRLEFGDGTTISNTLHASHRWTTPGIFDIVLTAYNNDHSTGTSVTQQIEILDLTIRVSPNGSDLNDGSSWDDAKRTIQAAVDAATLDGQTILVADGTYQPASEITVTNSISIRSVNGPDATIIDGRRSSRCFNLGSSSCAVSGFTIANGYTTEEGGGVYCEDGTPVVSNCTFVGNSANSGGGLRHGTANSCMFSGNSAIRRGGGLCYSTANSCTFTGNAASSGGGMSDGIANNCTFTGNSSRGTHGTGGGMSSGTANSCVFTGNSADISGGGMSSGTANSCTFSGNSATESGGGMRYGRANNCILWYNSSTRGANLYNTVAHYVCYQYAADGVNGCINDAPRFVDLANGDLRLNADSPCINAGDNALAVGAYDLDGNPRVFGGAVDMGAYELQSLPILPPVISITGTSVAVSHAVSNYTVSGMASDSVVGVIGWSNDLSGVSGSIAATANWSIFGIALDVGANTISVGATNGLGVAANDSVVITRSAVPPSGIHTGVSPIHYVSTDGSAIWPYTNWATAAISIQDAVDIAASNDTVLVDDGLYDMGGIATPGYACLNRVVITNAVTVRSVNGPEATIIKGAEATGGGVGSNAVRGVYMSAGLLVGFTITNGHTMESGDWRYDKSGGGIHMRAGDGVASNCVLAGNVARSYGGGSYYGTLLSCTVSGNSAGSFGGGSYSGERYNCIFEGNSAAYGGGTDGGTHYGCIVANNHADRSGGGSDGGTLHNCTVFGNSADNAGGGSYRAHLYNSIVWSNTAPASADVYVDQQTVRYSCSPSLPAADGNISTRPGFTDAANGDYRLEATSPCINAGSSDAWMAGATDLDGNPRIIGGTVDMGAYEFVPATVRFSDAVYQVSEAQPTVTARVFRDGDSRSNVRVGFSTAAVSGGATPGADYVPASGSLTFAAGETQKILRVQLIDDSTGEPPEIFKVGLSATGDNVLLPNPSDAFVVIEDDDIEQTVLIVDFDESSAPRSIRIASVQPQWTVIDNAGQGAVWVTTDPGGRGNLTGGGSGFAIADSAYAGAFDMDTELRSPDVSLADLTKVKLRFRTDLLGAPGMVAKADISTAGARGPWTTVWTSIGEDRRGPRLEDVDITAAVGGQSNVMVRFHYVGVNDAGWWQIDDVSIVGLVDSDQDGIPDWWEQLVYGGDADPNVDDDGDGATALDEFMADGKPFSPDLNASIDTSTNGTVSVSIQSSPLRLYGLQRRTNLVSGAWSDVHAPVRGVNGVLHQADSNTEGKASFYRYQITIP